MLGFAFASLWWSYQRFYAPFGVAPQDVGLTPSGGLGDIIGATLRLGLWLTLALVLLGLLPVLAICAIGYLVEKGAEANWRGWRLLLAGATALAAGACALTVYVWLTGWAYSAVALLAGVLSTAVWAYVVRHPLEADAKNDGGKENPVGETGTAGPGFRSWSLLRKAWALRLLDVFAAVAIVGLLLVDLPSDAADAADCATGKKPLAVRGIGAPWSLIHLTLLDVYAQPAVVSWDTSNPPADAPPEPFEAVYLGSANGWVIVYRKTAPAQLLRIPAGHVLVQTEPDAKTCQQAH